MSQPQVVLLTLALAATFGAGIYTYRTYLRFVLWRESGAAAKAFASVRRLAFACLVVGMIVLAVQARGGR